MRGAEQHYYSNSSNSHNMLKVVGASWLKTRISSMIIAGSLLFAVGSLYFIVMERPAKSGTYCATVYWSAKSGYRTEYWGQQNNLSLVPGGVARTCYSDSTLTNGWSQIEIETHPDYPDSRQAFAAGSLEGVLTYAPIYNHWRNTVQAYCEADEAAATFCEWLRDMLETNVAQTIERADRLAISDHYWHQIRLYFHQLDGLYSGWQTGVERAREDMELEFVDLVMLNAASDLPDMRVYYENFVREPATTSSGANEMEYHATPSKASMLLKFVCERVAAQSVVDGDDPLRSDEMRPREVLIGHSSDGHYSTMLRMLKRYKFHYHQSDGARREVSGVTVEFTGYPGALASSDDFYMLAGKRSKLTVGGIRMQNANVDMWKLVDAERSVLMAARVMAANRLAHNGYGWARVMSGHLGFGSKQWLVVDVARMHIETGSRNESGHFVMANRVTAEGFERAETVPIEEVTAVSRNWRENLLWIVDQLPGRLHAEDVTARILGGEGFWTGNGVPYFAETLAVSRIEHDDTLNQSNMWVAQSNVTRLDDVARVLRSRAYRGDLQDGAATVYGNIDMKLYAETSAARMQFRAIAGPLYFNHHVSSSGTSTGTAAADYGDTMPTTGAAILVDGDEIDPAALSEIDVYAERRPVRDDMRATAMLRSKHGPFRWSQSGDLAVDHSGHPDVFDFAPVSPSWAWPMQREHRSSAELVN